MTALVLAALAVWLWLAPSGPGNGSFIPGARTVRTALLGGARRDKQQQVLAENARVVRELAGLLRTGQGTEGAIGILLRIEGTANPVMAALAMVQAQRHTRTSLEQAFGQAAQGVQEENAAVVRRLGWCFQISQDSGAPLAEVLERLADDVESTMDAARTFEVAMAGPRSTTRLLTWLPLVGLCSGVLFGIDLMAVFSNSVLGRAAFGAGIVLWLLNRWWCALLLSRSTAKAVS